ncbi:Uncharacterised protein [Lysinibacillus sphaericus]|nr:Uncharacterised protein [Lysinibacillus sphaericus]
MIRLIAAKTTDASGAMRRISSLEFDETGLLNSALGNKVECNLFVIWQS